MTKFAQPKLEELMVKRRGSVDPSKFPAETFELFSIPAFDTGESVVISGSEIGSSKQNVESGDLLLSKIVPHIRRAWVVTPLKGYRQIASGEWMIFKHPDAFPDYLRHLLTSDWFHPQLMNTVAGVGGSLVRARPSEIARIEIPLPPLAEQKRIAAILDKADAIRRKLQQSLRLSDDFLRSVFLDMFGDPVTNPKGWKEVQIGEIGEVQGGLQLTPKRKPLPLVRPYLRVANVYRGFLSLDEIKELRMTENEFERTKLQSDDILVVEGHGNPNEIGRCAIWNGSIEDCVHQNHIIRVRASRKLIGASFLAAFLNSDGGSRRLKGESVTTSGLNTISVSKVRSALVHLPPLKLQTQFHDIATGVSRRIQKLETNLAQTETLFSSLQQRAFRGEL